MAVSVWCNQCFWGNGWAEICKINIYTSFRYISRLFSLFKFFEL